MALAVNNLKTITRMIIEIRDLRIYSHHGCYAEERQVGALFMIDADLDVDASLPARTDDVKDALNYVEACEVIAHVMRTPHHLLESLATDVIADLKARFSSKGLKGGMLRIAKMAPPIGLELNRVAVKVDF